MMYYGHSLRLAPPSCPHCGSRGTQIVDRSEGRRTVIVRCGSCGHRASLVVVGAGDRRANDEVVRLAVDDTPIERVVRS